MQVDLTAYKVFKKLKEKYPTKMVYITEADISSMPAILAGDHRSYVEKRFSEVGLVVSRHSHNYDSLTSHEPELGLVYMAGDSIVNPGYEVWGLVGHNIHAIAGTV